LQLVEAEHAGLVGKAGGDSGQRIALYDRAGLGDALVNLGHEAMDERLHRLQVPQGSVQTEHGKLTQRYLEQIKR
jgi:hypothetical protein